MNRIEKLMKALPEGADAALITSDVNRRYFTGLGSTAGTLLAFRDAAYFIIDFRYIEVAKATVTGAEVILQDKLYDQLGEEIYCEALRHIVAAWEGRPDSFRAAVLRGVMYFVQLYHGQYSAERLIRALSGVHPMELYRISRDNPAKLPGWRRYVYPIYTTYNGKCRKDALPMKF